MKLYYRPVFLEDIAREEFWLMEHASPQIADQWHASLEHTIEFLSRNPLFGRARQDLTFPGVRSWGVENFRRWIVFYGVREDALVFFRVLSGTMNLHVLQFE